MKNIVEMWLDPREAQEIIDGLQAAILVAAMRASGEKVDIVFRREVMVDTFGGSPTMLSSLSNVTRIVYPSTETEAASCETVHEFKADLITFRGGF